MEFSIMIAVYILGAIIFFFLVVIAIIYNSFIYKRNVVKNIFSTIDVLLKKRFDLIPNLVETVKGYAKHEELVFTRIAELRNQADKDDLSDDQKIELDNQVNNEMNRLMAVVESYPNLKADKNFMNLQITMTEIEDQISAARRAYNAAVTDFNNSCEMFPTNLFAGIFGFKRRTLFRIPDEEKNPVKPDFNR